MKASELNEKIKFVKQFASDVNDSGPLYEAMKRVRFVRTAPERFRISCINKDSGGYIEFDCDISPKDLHSSIELNVYELADYLAAVTKDGDMQFSMGSSLTLKIGRASKKLDFWPEGETLVQPRSPDSWQDVPDDFCIHLKRFDNFPSGKDLNLIFAYGHMYMLSVGGTYLLAVEQPFEGDFKIEQKHIKKIMSCKPKKMAITNERAFFAGDDCQIYVPLQTSPSPNVTKLIDVIGKEKEKHIQLDYEQTKEAFKVLSTVKVEENEPQIDVVPVTGGYELGIGKKATYIAQEMEITGHLSEPIKLPLRLFRHIDDLDLMGGDGKVNIKIPEEGRQCYVKYGKAIYFCALQRYLNPK